MLFIWVIYCTIFPFTAHYIVLHLSWFSGLELPWFPNPHRLSLKLPHVILSLLLCMDLGPLIMHLAIKQQQGLPPPFFIQFIFNWCYLGNNMFHLRNTFHFWPWFMQFWFFFLLFIFVLTLCLLFWYTGINFCNKWAS